MRMWVLVVHSHQDQAGWPSMGISLLDELMMIISNVLELDDKPEVTHLLFPIFLLSPSGIQPYHQLGSLADQGRNRSSASGLIYRSLHVMFMFGQTMGRIQIRTQMEQCQKHPTPRWLYVCRWLVKNALTPIRMQSLMTLLVCKTTGSTLQSVTNYL